MTATFWRFPLTGQADGTREVSLRALNVVHNTRDDIGYS